ncbi:hypothetical protein BC941DRAFT_430778 [Chlamydoabsidia padenii]|nr:hypothetical protein BC941DRAFT_430778 [Chlamydoabsidia padenii]
MTLNNTLYVFPYTLYSNVGVLLLHEKGVEAHYPRTPIHLDSGEQNHPDFIRINPLGQVPVLIHNGRSIPDTLDIARFLDKQDDTLKTYDESVLAIVEAFRQISIKAVKLGGSWTDEGDALATARAALVHYQTQYPDVPYGRRLETFDARARRLKDPAVCRQIKQKWEDLLDKCEHDLKDGRQFLVGHQHTLADVYATAFLFSASSAHVDGLFTHRPHLETYYQAQLSRPTVAQAFTRSS